MSRTLQLRTRLAIAGTVLIATTVATGLWSVDSFRRVSRVLGDTVAANERMTDATTTLDSALEREDDAVLLALSDRADAHLLPSQRGEVATALARVTSRLDSPREPVMAAQLATAVAEYERSVDMLVASPDRVAARTRYHDDVNPLLRRAVALNDEIRDDHFLSSQRIAEWAAAQTTRSMVIVGAVSLFALLLLILVVLHLARVVMRPLDEMTRAVAAIRRGDFSHRVGLHRDDELGRLGAGLNRMADELEEFRRTNIGEVLQAKETLEATLEALPDAVIVIDNARLVSSTNPRATSTLGSGRGTALRELPVPEATRTAVEDAVRTGTAPEVAVDLARAIELSSGGGNRRLLPRVVPIAGKRGAVLILSDVTDLARLDQMRLELVAVASHELRTPLTTMRMTLSMLQERTSAYEKHDRDLVATAMVGVEQLSMLVDEFLDLTRIEAGQLRLSWTRLSLVDLARDAVRAITPACEQARVTLSVEMAPNVPPSIAGDRARLATVVTNLLTNAVKHTPADGRIILRVRLGEPGYATIEVADSGPGVPVELRERVFDRFFRVARPDESSLASAGAGIGLYIARQVVEAHGGTIRCATADLGGAAFIATIPLERAAAS